MTTRSPAPALPGDALPQIVPGEVCLRCDVCCRFPERESFLRPYFTAEERERAIAHGLAPEHLPEARGGRIRLVPHPAGEGCLCPSFDPATQHCAIYPVRPLDCRLYPLSLMRDEEGRTRLLGLDTKCPYVQDPAHASTLAAYARTVGRLLAEPEPARVLADNPDLIGRYQEDVESVVDLGLPGPWRPLQLGDRPWIESLLAASPSELGVRTFPGVYLWRDHFTYVWRWIDGYFCLLAGYGFHRYMPWPPLPGPEADPRRWAEVVDAMFKAMALPGERGDAARIEGVDERESAAFEAAGYEVAAQSAEYLYRRHDLVDLRGNAYKTQRWAWNDFVKREVFTLGPLRDEDVSGCLALYRRWREGKRRDPDPYVGALAEDAESAHRRALTERTALGLSGLTVIIDGAVAGYTLGGPITPGVVGVWCEIADPARRGLAAYLFREYCRAQTGAEWINAMDDSGLPALARAKRAYRPARLVHSSVVCRRSPP